jgi:hypothetical protein
MKENTHLIGLMGKITKFRFGRCTEIKETELNKLNEEHFFTFTCAEMLR